MARDIDQEYQHYHAQITEGRISRAIEGSYNKVRNQFFHETRDGLFTVLGSGFGKAALGMAAAIVVGAAFLMGGLSLAGQLGTLPGGAPVPFVDAITGGAKMGIGLLTQPIGVGAIVGAGIAGGVSSWRKQNNEIAAQMAVAQARQAKREIEHAAVHTPALDMSLPEVADEPAQTTFRDKHPPKTKNGSFAAAELQRQQLAAAENGVQGVA